jgi:hypothetical protein
MKHPRYTPLQLIKAIERVNHKTPLRKVEGLMLALGRMIEQRKRLPRSKRSVYHDRWAYVALEIGRAKWCR